MKKGIYTFLTVLTVFAIIMTGCDNNGDTKPKTTVTLSQTTLTLGVGGYMQITATTNPIGAILTWTSNNPAVATVNPGGYVTGVSAGNATITAAAEDGGKATCAVTVTGQVTVITLSPTSLTVEVLGSNRITATTNPTGVILTWTSSNPAVATVNPGGYVTGVSEGNATITATSEDGGSAICAVTVTQAVSSNSDIEVVGDTLVHKTAKLVGVPHFGSDLGTTNDDGSYTFNGTAGSWSGGGAQYNFPVPKMSDTWSLSNYDIVEVFLKVTDGNVQVKPAKYGTNTDLMPYPSGSQYITLSKNTSPSYKFVIGEAGSGIGFQRNTSGPATVAIDKVVFSKGTIRTITFQGGDYTAMPAIPPIKIPDGRTVNFGTTSYLMPTRPTWEGHTFTKWYNDTDKTDFNISAAITKDLTLVAQWIVGEPDKVDMKLNLDKSSWDTLPATGALTGGSPSYTIPLEYAETTYVDGKLKLKFDGRNRQRAIVPLSSKQIEELLTTEESGVTFRIVGTVEKGADGGQLIASDGTTEKPADSIITEGLHFAGFRLHLGDPAATAGWNGTTTGKEYPLTGNADATNDHLVEYRSFDSNKKDSTVGYFIIQAMFRDKDGNAGTIKSGFPEVIITISSIAIEPGDTTQ